MELANDSHIRIYFQTTNSAKLEKRYSQGEWFEGREAGPLTLRTPHPEEAVPRAPLGEGFQCTTPYPAPRKRI
jgi:hypothetical protein